MNLFYYIRTYFYSIEIETNLSELQFRSLFSAKHMLHDDGGQDVTGGYKGAVCKKTDYSKQTLAYTFGCLSSKKVFTTCVILL